MKIKEALAQGSRSLKEKKIPLSRLEAEVLLAHLLQWGRVKLYSHSEEELPPEILEKYVHLLTQRQEGLAVAYLVGKKEFMGLDFTVTPAVLIPRPDTELLVELAVKELENKPRPTVADVGTGSGAIAVSLAHLLPQATVAAVDISREALAVATENAQAHQVNQRMTFYCGDLLTPLMAHPPEAGLDLITANLPYVPREMISQLAVEVRREPILALDGGPDGLDLYRRLIPQAQTLLKTGGKLLMEIGPGQGQALQSLLPTASWRGKIHRDLADRERLVVGEKK